MEARNNKDLLIMIMALGDAYLEKGLYGEAAKRYNQLLSLKVANQHIYTGLSKALIGLKQFDEKAIVIYQRAIRYEPDNSEIYNILANTFLKEKREDANAILVYEMALRQDTPQFQKLAEHLSIIYLSQKEFEKCRDITGRLIDRAGYLPRFLQMHVQSSYEVEEFHDLTNRIKKLLDLTENNTELLNLLCRVYLERKFSCDCNNQSVRFSYIDKQMVADQLSQTRRFETLQDVSFFLELKRFSLEKACWGATEANSDVETETIFAYQSLEQSQFGQAGGTPPPSAFHLNREVLKKLNSFEGPSSKSDTPRSPLTFEDFQKDGASIFSQQNEVTGEFDVPGDADILVTIELSNFEEVRSQFGVDQVNQIRKKFLVVVADSLEKFHVANVWATANGLLVFANDVVQAVSLAVDLLNILNRYNFVNEPQEQVHLAVGIHHAREGLNGNNEQTLRDLSVGIKIGTVGENDLSARDRAMYGRVFQKTDRIFLSAKATREIKSSNRFKVNSLGQFKTKFLPEELSLSEIAWRNPIDELKFGYIKKLGRFELLAEVGGKGAVKVYKAKDANLQRFVIIKVIQSEAFNSLPANNPQKEEFYKMATALGQLNHPNVVTIYEVDEDQALTYIAREYVEGVPITEVFTGGNFNAERFIKIIYQTFKGLVYSHRFGFFHRNLKPNNIMVCQNDETKIMDFLIPSTLFEDQTHRPMPEDSDQLYLAPEQVHGHEGDNRSDIFAFGVIMYQILTMKHPFASANYQSLEDAILHIEPPPPSQLNTQVPRFCDALVQKCLEKNPAKRFQSGDQIVDLLKKNFERILFSNFNHQIAQSRDSY